jgi:hypothetical protein
VTVLTALMDHLRLASLSGDHSGVYIRRFSFVLLVPQL